MKKCIPLKFSECYIPVLSMAHLKIPKLTREYFLRLFRISFRFLGFWWFFDSLDFLRIFGKFWDFSWFRIFWDFSWFFFTFLVFLENLQKIQKNLKNTKNLKISHHEKCQKFSKKYKKSQKTQNLKKSGKSQKTNHGSMVVFGPNCEGKKYIPI